MCNAQMTVPRFELGLVDSESTVITATLHRRHIDEAVFRFAGCVGFSEHGGLEKLPFPLHSKPQRFRARLPRKSFHRPQYAPLRGRGASAPWRRQGQLPLPERASGARSLAAPGGPATLLQKDFEN